MNWQQRILGWTVASKYWLLTLLAFNTIRNLVFTFTVPRMMMAEHLIIIIFAQISIVDI